MHFPSLHSANTAIALRADARHWTYAELEQRSRHVAGALLGDQDDLMEQRIAFFMPASLDYVTTLLGVWRAGGIAVPLNVGAALPELEYVLATAEVATLLFSDDSDAASAAALKALCTQLGIATATVADLLAQTANTTGPVLAPERRALMLFTSGTTNKPKGVVTTHGNIDAQITTLITAWCWQADDRIPLFLPLHHIHGIVNVLCCALWAGATVDLFARFDMDAILDRVAAGHYSVFMAVPTIYVKIVQHLETVSAQRRTAVCDGFGAMRLNVSGSAACPVKLFEQWKTLTGQILLERYGMTEIGMAISNPYRGERRAGAVGLPLPGVDVALYDDDGKMIDIDDVPGEIRIRGATVFREYWRNPQATQESFSEGWFRTGDIALREGGYYRIMGRASVDIIKSGGYKLSALEIEGALLTHTAIAECAVVGLPDATWGEAVAAFVVLKPGSRLDLATLKSWCAPLMSPYKLPKQLHVLESLPRNAMGKVLKPALVKLAANNHVLASAATPRQVV
jgi:malonyl-CoA/methylmalonyl-CoA synthetase